MSWNVRVIFPAQDLADAVATRERVLHALQEAGLEVAVDDPVEIIPVEDVLARIEEDES